MHLKLMSKGGTESASAEPQSAVPGTTYVELGAEEIHGSDQSCLYDILTKPPPQSTPSPSAASASESVTSRGGGCRLLNMESESSGLYALDDQFVDDDTFNT